MFRYLYLYALDGLGCNLQQMFLRSAGQQCHFKCGAKPYVLQKHKLT